MRRQKLLFISSSAEHLAIHEVSATACLRSKNKTIYFSKFKRSVYIEGQFRRLHTMEYDSLCGCVLCGSFTVLEQKKNEKKSRSEKQDGLSRWIEEKNAVTLQPHTNGWLAPRVVGLLFVITCPLWYIYFNCHRSDTNNISHTNVR